MKEYAKNEFNEEEMLKEFISKHADSIVEARTLFIRTEPQKKEEIDTYITDTFTTLYSKYEEMSNEELAKEVPKKLVTRMLDELDLDINDLY